jgi:electron transfer flavoprotein alpha subunit
MMQDAPIPRRNPRRPATLTAAGIKRIVLGQQGEGGVFGLAAHEDAPKPLRLSVEPSATILAVTHADRGALDGHAQQVIAAAALLADSATAVVALVFGDLTEDLAPLGADRVIVIPTESWQPEHELACIRAVIAQFQPRHVLFPDNDGGDGDLGRRLAAAEGDGACHISELSRDGIGVRRHAGRLVARRELPKVLLLDADIVDPSLPFLGQARETTVPLPAEGRGKLRDLGRQAVAAAELPLEEADFILSAGNGVADIPTFLALADAFGAAVGASRVAVDDGKFPRAKQIGATGKTVSASLYMAIGISGAIQHLQGIKACRHVIAINSDASAPIAKRADLTVVGDAQDVMRHLLRDITDPGRNDMEDQP